jgi:hypothetical protein
MNNLTEQIEVSKAKIAKMDFDITVERAVLERLILIQNKNETDDKNGKNNLVETSNGQESNKEKKHRGKGRKSPTGHRGIAIYNRADGSVVYRVNVWDKYKSTVRSGGTANTIEEAIKKRDELDAKIKREHTTVNPKDRICQFGWECSGCGKPYDMRVRPVICEACEGKNFYKQAP